MNKFRFQDLTIWQDSISISDRMFDIADAINESKFFRFAEQLRAAALSISNNIAEGSGSVSDKDFACFLNFARRSIFECANMLLIFERRKLISSSVQDELFPGLIVLSSQITNFRKTLLKGHRGKELRA